MTWDLLTPLGHSRHRAGSGWADRGIGSAGRRPRRGRTPPVTVMVLGWVALAAVVGGDRSFASSASAAVWLVAVGYAVACQMPIYLMRSSRFTALELAQTLRYLPDLVVVLALLAAVGLCAPNRERSRRLDASPAADGRNRRRLQRHS